MININQRDFKFYYLVSFILMIGIVHDLTDGGVIKIGLHAALLRKELIQVS